MAASQLNARERERRATPITFGARAKIKPSGPGPFSRILRQGRKGLLIAALRPPGNGNRSNQRRRHRHLRKGRLCADCRKWRCSRALSGRRSPGETGIRASRGRTARGDRLSGLSLGTASTNFRPRNDPTCQPNAKAGKRNPIGTRYQLEQEAPQSAPRMAGPASPLG